MQGNANAISRTALIIGGSGLVGSHCLDYLLAEKTYTAITALVRRPMQRSHPKLVERIIDFDNIEKYRDDIRGQDVYCCIGTTFLKSPVPSEYFKIDFTYPYEIAKIALQNGAEQFALVSALSANPNGIFPYSRVKGKLERAIIDLRDKNTNEEQNKDQNEDQNKEQDKVRRYQSVIILRPSYLKGKREEWRPIEKMGNFALTILSLVLAGPLAKMRAIKAGVVAKVLVELSLKSSMENKLESKNRVQIYESDEIQKIYDTRK